MLSIYCALLLGLKKIIQTLYTSQGDHSPVRAESSKLTRCPRARYTSLGPVQLRAQIVGSHCLKDRFLLISPVSPNVWGWFSPMSASSPTPQTPAGCPAIQVRSNTHCPELVQMPQVKRSTRRTAPRLHQPQVPGYHLCF